MDPMDPMLSRVREKLLGIFLIHPDAQQDAFLLTLLLADTLTDGEQRLLNTIGEILPHSIESWLKLVEADAERIRACHFGVH